MGLKIAIESPFPSWLLNVIPIPAFAYPILSCIYRENPPIVSKDNPRFNILSHMTLYEVKVTKILLSAWLVSIYPFSVKECLAHNCSLVKESTQFHSQT